MTVTVTKITEGAYLVPLGTVNSVLLNGGSELVLIDAGWPGKVDLVLDALARIGREPSDVTHLVLTHAHPDHIGSAAAIVAKTGARTYMHPVDAPVAESGGPFRPLTPGPGLIRKAALKLIYKPASRVEPVQVDHFISDGEMLPIGGGLQVIHAPGHCAGQVALLWQKGRLLLTADTFINVLRPTDPIGFEDATEGWLSQAKLAGLDFDVVCFGHGGAITKDAKRKLRAATRRRR